MQSLAKKIILQLNLDYNSRIRRHVEFGLKVGHTVTDRMSFALQEHDGFLGEK